MLSVVATPAAAIVAATSVLTSESTIVAVAALLLLVTSGVLVTEAAEAAILVVSSNMAGVTAEALLLRMLRTLSALSRGVLRSRSRATRLRSKSRRTWSASLRLAKRLQGLFAETLLTALLLSI